ncbi:hypothetical protein GCK72_002650 [Caenorhabditis remanei]|uniref:DUF38 domain-containing protein n=1 Tax=Caenorhabditis remanei TaxID=31234 RepID=A0A6A5HVK0_CAERE|nr:hypothetical protein GCK72_002650 [Caenorhabditis remanei]KAF1770826.1 hypothetical protein GCK72_002650 [Caenorhabditis remanei]
MTEITKTLNKCERPQNSKIDISFCELSMEDESNLQDLIDECSSLKIANTFSKSRFSRIFEKPKNRLEKLELICVDFRDESQIISIFKSCQSLKTLNLSGIRVASTLPHLVNLDLSFNSSWISEQNWNQLLKGLEKLEELAMNETKCDVQFESDWLPHLSIFSARGSDLHWDSIFEMLSVSDRITRVDVRFSTIDSSLPEELQKGNLRIGDILY